MENGRTKTGPIFLKGDSGIGILLFHGWTSPPDELLPLAEYLNSFGYTVNVPLLRGHGTKPEDLMGVTWKDWQDDSIKALSRIKGEADNIFLCGVSMGGNLALLAEGDESVRGIILLGTPVKFRYHDLGKAALYLMGLTKTMRKKYYTSLMKKNMGGRNVYLSYPIENAKEVARLSDYTRKNLSRVTKPLLIIQSRIDHMVSKKSPKIIFDGVKSKTKEIFWLENAYHVFAGNRKVWKKIGEFIGEISNI